MKKILIIFMLLLVLAGCNTNQKDILSTMKEELDVCLENCETSLESFTEYEDGYNEKVDELMLQLTGELTEVTSISFTSRTFLKEDILREDPYSQNLELPIVLPYSRFLGAVDELGLIARFCNSGESCDYPSHPDLDNLSYVRFGFNESEGYFRITDSNDQGIVEIEEMKFIFTEEGLSFSIIVYSPQFHYYNYRYFDQGVFREYQYAPETSFTFGYTNINTLDYISYHYEYDHGDSIVVYHPETQILYKKTDADSFAVSVYDEMNLVVSLAQSPEQCILKIGLFYMNGWDTMEYRPGTNPGYSNAFNEGQEVFTDFDIDMYYRGFNYLGVDATKHMSLSEWNDYVFPVEYIGSFTQDELLTELDYLNNLEDLLSLTPLKFEDIEATMMNIFALQEKQSIE